jgi:hypothetical protein
MRVAVLAATRDQVIVRDNRRRLWVWRPLERKWYPYDHDVAAAITKFGFDSVEPAIFGEREDANDLIARAQPRRAR